MINKLNPALLLRLFSTNKSKSLYQILKIPINSTQQQIKLSYYKLAKQYHPDKLNNQNHSHKLNKINNQNPSDKVNQQQYNESFKQINQAYNTLKDSKKRKQYDQQNFTQKGQKKQYKFYNTQHNYGYNNHNHNNNNNNHNHHHNHKRNPFQTQNPFQSSFYTQNPYKQSSSGSTTNPYHNQFGRIFRSSQQFDQYVKQQHRKNIKQSRKEGTQRLNRSNNIVIVVIGLISVWIVGQLTFKIYQFNSSYKNRSYAQKLDPGQLRQYEQLMRNNPKNRTYF